MIYPFRPLPLMNGCRWMTYHLTSTYYNYAYKQENQQTNNTTIKIQPQRERESVCACLRVCLHAFVHVHVFLALSQPSLTCCLLFFLTKRGQNGRKTVCGTKKEQEQLSEMAVFSVVAPELLIQQLLLYCVILCMRLTWF